ncbi:hypothetical protein KY290_028279 [Solanum tuberosum]|uniref:Uncharacterized protein n=1 Tax=Solanum tuberosum TaxID=4113 RepID=A0ABQ7UJA7_SOLTU|nr:hypothetical protein KY290_028279 [Solanum tuberosum]
MHSSSYFYIIIWFLIPFLFGSGSSSSDSSAKSSLDSLLQQYAFRELTGKRTRNGVPYDAHVPSSLTGVKVSAMILKTHSLKRKVCGYYKNFFIPSGIIEEPYVKKLVLVYQNLANWSSFYYPLPGYTYLAPVFGILVYDAHNLYAKYLRDLDIQALEDPISVKFPYVQPAPEGSSPKCVYFYSNNFVQFGHVKDGNICETRMQGHFSIVAEVKVAPSPPPNANDTAPSPSPIANETAPSPSPSASDTAPSPSPSANDTAPSPSPSANDTAPSPSPSANETAPSPSPSANETTPSPSPSANDTAPSPTPTPDEDNHQKINSKTWTISSVFLFFSLTGILFVFVNKSGLLEIRQRLYDSAAVVVPLLGKTEVPLSLEAPTRPLPENDYVL